MLSYRDIQFIKNASLEITRFRDTPVEVICKEAYKDELTGEGVFKESLRIHLMAVVTERSSRNYPEKKFRNREENYGGLELMQDLWLSISYPEVISKKPAGTSLENFLQSMDTLYYKETPHKVVGFDLKGIGVPNRVEILAKKVI